MADKAVVVGGFVCCILVICAIVLAVKVTQNQVESCTDKTFHDIPVAKFRVEEKFWTTRQRSEIFPYDTANMTKLGSLTNRPSVFKTAYSYRDMYDNVVAQATKGSLKFSFTIERCTQPKSFDTYELERVSFILFGRVEWKLRKNGELIGLPSKSAFGCQPDVMIESFDGSGMLAVLDRSCQVIVFTDTWLVINYKPNILENYVVAYIAYIVTNYENEENSKKKKT